MRCVKRDCLRGKVAALARQYGNKDFVVRCDFVHGARELVVVFSAQRVEFLGDIEGYDGEGVAVFDGDGFGGGHGE